jgi:ABC-2 type transport system permease protein
VIDRFRSLPMTRSSVLIGRTASDVVYNVLSLLVMTATGLVIGWRVHTSLVEALAGFALLLLFAYAFSWVMAYVGLLVPSVEVVNNASFMVIFPLTFIADTFVPIQNFPTVLRVFAEWNPVSAVALASRQLFGNVPPGLPAPTAWSLQHPVVYTLLWVVVILAVFVPLSTRQYKRAASR